MVMPSENSDEPIRGDTKKDNQSSLTNQIQYIQQQQPQRQQLQKQLSLNSTGSQGIIKPSLKRYIILFLFCLNAGNKSFQWIQIPASTKKVTYYYDVDNYVINACSVLFMLAFVVLSWPACYLIDHLGLRKSVLIGSFGTAIGALIKCFSCTEDGIYLLFIAQVLVSLSEQFVFSVPNRLASVWFPDHQVSSAVALTILGQQFGVAFGFVIPQILLDSAHTKDEVGWGLYYMFLGTAAVSVFAFVADWALFDEAPKYAPGNARLKQIEEELQLKEQKQSFVDEMALLWAHTTKLLTNRHYFVLTMSYGINVGIGYTIHTLLNQMLEPLYPGDDILVGNTGFIIIVSGALASAFWGQMLDKMHRYLFINVLLTIGTLLALLVFGYAISYTDSKLAIYLGALLLGFFQTGFLVSGLELAVELTYPSPELVTSSLMNVMPQIYGTVFVFVGSYIVDNYGALATNIFYLISVAVGLVLLATIKETLKRQNAVIAKRMSMAARAANKAAAAAVVAEESSLSRRGSTCSGGFKVPSRIDLELAQNKLQ